MNRKRKIQLSLFLLVSFTIATIFYCDNKVEAASVNKIFSQPDELPYNRVGVLLGTGKFLGDGDINLYYKYRVDAAVRLMKAGKITFLVISGDNSRVNYNEPQMMKDDLIAEGIDSTCIFLDYAGFRTFDSMIRLKEIFSQDSVTVISQEFHNQRALFIAQKENIFAIGFNAKDVSSRNGFRTQIREKLARVKVFADYIFNIKPKFLGPKINIR